MIELLELVVLNSKFLVIKRYFKNEIKMIFFHINRYLKGKRNLGLTFKLKLKLLTTTKFSEAFIFKSTFLPGKPVFQKFFDIRLHKRFLNSKFLVEYVGKSRFLVIRF